MPVLRDTIDLSGLPTRLQTKAALDYIEAGHFRVSRNGKSYLAIIHLPDNRIRLMQGHDLDQLACALKASCRGTEQVEIMEVQTKQ